MKARNTKHDYREESGLVPLVSLNNKVTGSSSVRSFKHATSLTGFTLVETLVAVTILLVAIAGPMTIASRGMQNAYYAGDQTTAIYLAQ